jgi:hypothetical protein
MEPSNGGGGLEMLLILVLFLLPAGLTLFSKKIPNVQKPVWLLVTVLFSWVGYLYIYFKVIKKARL